MSQLKAITFWFAGLSPRERAGVAAATAVALFALCIGVFDAAMAARQVAVEAKTELLRVQGSAAREADPDFQRQVSEEVNKVWRWSIVDSSEGLVRAQALSLFEQIVAEAGLADAQISSAEAMRTAEAIGVVRVRVSAQFDWSSFNALLDAIATADESIVIESVEVSGAGEGGQTLTLDLAAPFVLEASS